MFGMILKLQAFMERLKKKKALWFTTLTTLSILGIVGTLYYLNSMTSRAAKNLYEATNASYFYDLDSKVADSMHKLDIMGSMLVNNQGFVGAMNNQNDTAGITAQLKKVSADASKIDKNIITVELYNKNLVKIASSAEAPILNGQPYDSKAMMRVVATNQPITAIEYQDGQVFLRAVYPLANGILEVKKSADFLFDVYSANDKVFQVLLDKDLLDMKKVQEFKSQKIGKSEISVQSKVDKDFLQKISELDFDKIITDKYMLTDEYFVLAKPILNTDGKRVGMFIIGENMLKDNSLPKMTKGISTGLTTAALGLVVALLVLMI